MISYNYPHLLSRKTRNLTKYVNLARAANTRGFTSARFAAEDAHLSMATLCRHRIITNKDPFVGKLAVWG